MTLAPALPVPPWQCGAARAFVRSNDASIPSLLWCVDVNYYLLTNLRQLRCVRVHLCVLCA